MDDDCEEIYTGGLLKRQSKLPAKLEDLTLADWAAWYDFSGKPYVKPPYDLDIDGLPLESCIEHHEDDDDLNDDKGNENQCGKTKKRNKARIIRSVQFNKDADPEKHYRELIMLYTAWRNEETDLLGGLSSYQESYKALFKPIEEQMKQYAVCNEDFNDIQQDIHRQEEMYDSVAPLTESIEQQHCNEGNQDLHPDFNENYNLSDDIGIPSVDSRAEPLILNELPVDEYRCVVQTLNKEQKEFFYHVLHLVKTSDEPFFELFVWRGRSRQITCH